MKVEEFIASRADEDVARNEINKKLTANYEKKRGMHSDCLIQRGTWAATLYFDEWDGGIVIHVGTASELLDDDSSRSKVAVTLPRSGMTTEFHELLTAKTKQALDWIQGKCDTFPANDCARKAKKTRKTKVVKAEPKA